MVIERKKKDLLSPHQQYRWQLPLVGLLFLSLGVATGGSIRVTAQQAQSQPTLHSTLPATALPQQKEEVQAAPFQTAQTSSIPDGVYLYGQSSEPEQIGKEYIVFEARQGKLIGALYLPMSEFSCFHGSLDSERMNLTVMNPYDQTAIAHTIARETPSSVAAAGGQINLENTYDSLKYPYAVQLEGYHQIQQVSENDRRILGVCQETLQDEV